LTKPRYDRELKTVISETIDVSGIDVIIFEGLYAIANTQRLGNLREFIDLPIYLSAGLDDIKEWRYEQEREKSHPRTPEQMDRHWTEGILPDLINNIAPSIKNARFVIEVESDHSFIIERT
jgi:uridine kinase